MTDKNYNFIDRVIAALDQAISHWRTALSEPARVQLSIHDMSALRVQASLSVEGVFIEEQNLSDSGDLDPQSEPPRSPSHDELSTERAEETSADTVVPDDEWVDYATSKNPPKPS